MSKKKLIALVVFRNQTVSKTTALLKPFEALPPRTQGNVTALGLERRFAKRRDIAGEVGGTFTGKQADALARAVAEHAGFEVITYQEITFRRARQEAEQGAGNGRR